MTALWRGLAIAFGTFVVVTAIASLLGAANLGTAMTFGQIAFMLAIVLLILFGDRDAEPPAEPPAAPRRPKPAPPPRRRRRA